MDQVIQFNDGELVNSNDPAMPVISPAAVPYLIGAFPQGTQSSDAHATDLQYPRPLTEEERRARFLYWGRAPKSAYGGLPKFDGKDFYPPSPTKESVRLRQPSTAGNSFNRRHLTPAERNFERLFSVPQSVNYSKASLEAKSRHGSPNLSSTAPKNSPTYFQSPASVLSSKKNIPSPWLLDEKESRYEENRSDVRHAAGHSNEATSRPDLSKLLIAVDEAETRSSQSLRLESSPFSIDHNIAKHGSYASSIKAPRYMKNEEGADEAKSMGSWAASSHHYEVGNTLSECATGRHSSIRESRLSGSMKTASPSRSSRNNISQCAESSNR